MSLPLCDNCGRPAKYTVTLEGGYGETDTCGRCQPAAAVEWRPVDQPAAKPLPLTVEQAAVRESVSTRTVHRWIKAGALGEGAWKVGAAWRIDPAALEARRATPRPARSETTRKRPQRRKRAAAPADGGWPA
jgi:excisionase family DNA binding protein